MFSKLHYLAFKQSPDTIKSMHNKEEWCNLFKKNNFKVEQSKQTKSFYYGLEHLFLVLNCT